MVRSLTNFALLFVLRNKENAGVEDTVIVATGQ